MKEREKQQTKGRVVLAARVLFLELFTTGERPIIWSLSPICCVPMACSYVATTLFFLPKIVDISPFFFFVLTSYALIEEWKGKKSHNAHS